MNAVIDVQHLKKIFNKETALQDVSFTIQKGEIFGFLGPSGSGKTTTIKMLSTIIKPDSGSLFIDDDDIISQHKKWKDRLNVISGGERNLYWRLTGRENLEYFGSLYGLGKKELAKRIEHLLKLVGLSEVQDLPVERYSKGMKQRLQIARGLVNNPTYLFLDEPTLGLDVTIAKEIRSYIKSVSKEEGKGILLTTHYISEADELCDYIYVINAGTIIEQGTPDELKKMFSGEVECQITVEKITHSLANSLTQLSEKENFYLSIEGNIITTQLPQKYVKSIIQTIQIEEVLMTDLKLNEPNLEEVIIAAVRRSECEEIFYNSTS